MALSFSMASRQGGRKVIGGHRHDEANRTSSASRSSAKMYLSFRVVT